MDSKLEIEPDFLNVRRELERRDELEGEHYMKRLEELRAQKEAEYLAEFGEEFRYKHPLAFDHPAMYRQIMKEIEDLKK